MSQVSSVFSKKKTALMGGQKSQSFKEKKISAIKQKAEVVLSESNDQYEDREPLVTLNEVEEGSSSSGSSKSEESNGKEKEINEDENEEDMKVKQEIN